MTSREQFYSTANETMLDRLLYADFKRRTGGDLTEKQVHRLEKTVKHYMTEVYTKQPGQSLQYLNKEVLTSVVPDYMSYLRRGNTGADTDAPLQMDVTNRFDRIQQERQEVKPTIPAMPDFQISLDSDGPTPLSRFEEIKRLRESEAARESENAAMMLANGPMEFTAQEIVVSPSSDSPIGRMIDSDADFRNEAEAARARDKLSLIMREAERSAAGPLYRTEIVNTPDPRRLLLGDATTLTPRSKGIATANPTLPLAERESLRPPLPQDVLKPQDSVVTYKEVEHNLYVYSADRDWTSNILIDGLPETRYNFSVVFDPANNQSGFGNNVATNIKFKNIARIEFVKAIMPTESFDVLTTSSSTAGTPTAGLYTTILSLPYIQVRIPELNANGYGTNDSMNNAFAALSYEAYWASDSTANNRGYARMIPKFLKCQKVYYPTPLATLQKLTFQFQRPDGNLISTSTDTLDVSGVFMPINTAATTNYRATGATTWEWIWITTKTYFSKFTVTQGDRIIFKNVAMNSNVTGVNATSLTNFINRPEGHLVSDIGRLTGSTYVDGVNTAGYANGIIIRNDFRDPASGATTVNPWVTSIAATVNSNPSTTAGRLINMNHQLQVIMRVITREMDSASKLRPDNLQA